jgi:hypothetical protein
MRAMYHLVRDWRLVILSNIPPVHQSVSPSYSALRGAGDAIGTIGFQTG